MRAFKCCVSKKRFGACMAGLTYVMLAHDWKKRNHRRGIDLYSHTLCDEGVTMEVSTGMGGRVILAGKSQREKTISWHRL